MSATLPLTRHRLDQIELHWSRRRWIAGFAVAGLGVALFGAFSRLWLLAAVAPFALFGAWLAYGAWHIHGRFEDATWFRGEFEVTKSGSNGELRARLWDEDGHVAHTRNKMQGRVRSGRPKRGCHFALLGRFLLVIQDGDSEGVLVPRERPLSTGLTAVTVVDG